MNFFEDERFNLVIDKATFDDVVCGPGAAQNSVAMLEEIYRVLANNGTYICISHGPPEVRMKYFDPPAPKNPERSRPDFFF